MHKTKEKGKLKFCTFQRRERRKCGGWSGGIKMLVIINWN
jgi:hypothetical protein